MFVCFSLTQLIAERALQALSPDLQEYIMIVDCANVGYGDVPPLKVIQELSGILSKHYPRRLGQVYVVNISYIVTWIYDMIAFYLSDVTKKKFRFISGGKNEMRAVIGEKK